MRYLSIFKSPERNAPPSQEEMERMGRYIEESIKKGELIATEGCLPRLARRFLGFVGGEGECEIRQLYEAPAAVRA